LFVCSHEDRRMTRLTLCFTPIPTEVADSDDLDM
jgi:hypothetical protein